VYYPYSKTRSTRRLSIEEAATTRALSPDGLNKENESLGEEDALQQEKKGGRVKKGDEGLGSGVA
jgi:hypothetical protein